jgi:hypothetical protein
MAIRVVLLAVTVGAIAAGVAAFDGSGACGSAVSGGGGDVECYRLVRVLSERLGLLVAAATAVLTLTAMGLNRLIATSDPSRPDDQG